MALKSVTGSGRKFITPDKSFGSTSLEVGQSIEGTLILIESYTDKDDLVKTPMYFLCPEGTLLGVDDKTGENIYAPKGGGIIRVYPSGNIKYAIEDGKLTLGQYTVITRIEDKKVKGRTSTQFDIQQDDERVLEDFDGVMNQLYAKSAAAYAAKKEAEGGGNSARPAGTVTKGMTRNEKARANTQAKAKLLE